MENADQLTNVFAPRKIGTAVLFLFVLGWVTEQFSLVDFGRYSIPLLYLAALPLCLQISSRSFAFVFLPVVSAVFGVVAAYLGGVDVAHICSQLALQILAILAAAGTAAIDWREYSAKLAKALMILGIPVVAYGGYQMIARTAHLPFAFLPVTNQQEYALGGLQRGWEKSEFTRASSFFVEPAAFGYFCLWLIILGLSGEKGRIRNAALALGFAGTLFSQSLSAVLGIAVVLTVYLLTHPVNGRLLRQVGAMVVVAVCGLIVIPPLVPDAFDRFSERIQQAVSLDDQADSGRVDHLPANWEIFKASPIWGHGISSLSTAEADGLDVTSVTYALLLMERGVFGTILFLVPWVLVAWRSVTLPRSDVGRTLAILLSALNLYAFATSSVAYFLPFWFSLGITGSLALRTCAPPTRDRSWSWDQAAV